MLYNSIFDSVYRPRTDNYLSLLFLVSVLSQTLLALVSGHFVFLSFFSTWHNVFWFCPDLSGLVEQ